MELILKPRPGEHGDLAEAREVWWKTRNAMDAYGKLSRKQTIEGMLLQGLCKHNKNDYVNALEGVSALNRRVISKILRTVL